MTGIDEVFGSLVSLRVLEPVHAGHDDVHENNVGPGIGRLANALFAAVSNQCVEAGLFQHVLEEVQLGG